MPSRAEGDPPAQGKPIGDGPVPEHGPRGRPKAAWTSITIGVVVAVLVVIFIAQNTRKVEVSFLGWSGNFSLAVALLVATLSGAVIVLLVGTIRVTQLRRAERRQRRRLSS